MKKRLFNIHKLIGINVILFFFISLFFGILTIYQPYINLWEDSKKHFPLVNIEDIPLDVCVKQVSKRSYFDQNGKKLRNDIIKLAFPVEEVTASNLIRVKNRPDFYLDPRTCKRIRPKSFTISLFFDRIHTGAIFNSLLFKILFGFMSVAVVFLSLSGLYLILKNSYRNGKTKTIKGFYAKYHRLLLLYTLPLVFMFGLTGALFNLGVYSSPLLTKYLTKGQTANVLKVKRNILVDPDLKTPEPSKKTKTLNLNTLYKEAKKQFDNITFYQMQVYNYNDINAKVKFIGYEPNTFFISSMTNETYIVLDGITGNVLDKKMAIEGSFAEKTLDTIFYFHYLRTFVDIPRLIFSFLCLIILFGLSYGITLWLERAKKDKFTFKVLKPLSFTVMLGSLVSVSLLFASNWLISKEFLQFDIMGKLFVTQQILFYLSYVFVFIYILIKKDLFKVSKNLLFLSGIFLIIAVLSHNIFSTYNFFTLYKMGMYKIFFTDIAFLIVSFVLIFFSKKLKEEQFSFDKK